MSDEEDESMSEGFSASEDEWKPTKEPRGGESSDDDDSDFEDSNVGSGGAGAGVGPNKKKDNKAHSTIKSSASVKKRKPMGQSLRSKLYNKYRPPPKTFPTSPGNSPTTSAGLANRATASKNVKTPNESGGDYPHANDSSSDSSVEDYLVNPADLDLRSSFFDAVGGVGVSGKADHTKEKSPAPYFDCNAGVANLTDSGSEDNNDSSLEDDAKSKAFDFRKLLEKANSLERAKETIAKRAAEKKIPKSQDRKGSVGAADNATDVNALLALGENKRSTGDTCGGENTGDFQITENDPSKLSKTKSTRVKRHTKTRPASTVVAGGDTDDSDWEEVAGEKGGDEVVHSDANGLGDTTAACNELLRTGNLEIVVDLPTRQRTKQEKTKMELEMQLKRKLNREIKERQLLLHKTSLLCCFARGVWYNRLLNDTELMQETLKLLPSKNAYPTDHGTEIKYFQTFITWFKTAIKLNSPNLYPEKTAKRVERIKEELLEQIVSKQARCKQDMIFIFVVLARAMGMHCRLIINMQPIALKPRPTDLLTISLKPQNGEDNGKKAKTTKVKAEGVDDDDGSDEEETKTKKKDVKKASSSSKPKMGKETDSKSKILNKSADSHKKRNSFVQSETQESPKTIFKIKPVHKIIDFEHCLLSMDIVDKRKETTREPTQASNKSKRTTTTTIKNSTANNAPPQKEKASNNVVNEKSSVVAQKRSKPALSKLKPADGTATSKIESGPTKKVRLTKAADGATSAAATVVQTVRKTSKEISKSRAKPDTAAVPRVAVDAAPVVEVENAKSSRTSATEARSRSKSPKMQISPLFMQSESYKKKFSIGGEKTSSSKAKSLNDKVKVSVESVKADAARSTRVLRTRQQKTKIATATEHAQLQIPQLDGNDDELFLHIPQLDGADDIAIASKRPRLEKLKKSRSKEDSDNDFEPSPPKPVKKAPPLARAVQQLRADRRVLSTDVDDDDAKSTRSATAADMWIELWSDVEERWICVDLFKGKVHSVESIRKSASSSLAYVFAFQNDLSIKDVTARYCANWSTTVRKARVEKVWLDEVVTSYLGKPTKRDIVENQELRRIHEDKPMPTSIAEYKDHPLYVLERHLLKFQGIYPSDAPTLGFIRGEPVYSRDCVHLLHSREIWLKQARTVKLGEQPYKIVKARPKWDRITQSVIKDQPLEIFGYWQTEDYDPPTAENGIVPRNAYGNVELFKACMLPKKTVHLRLPGLNRICKKMGIDCANAVIGFDFHQGACHPTYDGFVVCEEFMDQVTAAWYQDQEDQDRKEQEKYEARVYGNWKKLIKGLLIRERLKKKYNF